MAVMTDEQFQALLRRIEETTAAVTAASSAPPEPTPEEVFVSRYFAPTSQVRPPFDARAILAGMAEQGTASAPPWSAQAA